MYGLQLNVTIYVYIRIITILTLDIISSTRFTSRFHLTRALIVIEIRYNP